MSAGLIYLAKISTDTRDWTCNGGLYKIGQTSNLKARLPAIRSIFGEPVSIVAKSKVGNRYAAERKLHEKFNDFRCAEPLGIKHLSVREFFIFDNSLLDKVIVAVWKIAEEYPCSSWGEA